MTISQKLSNANRSLANVGLWVYLAPFVLRFSLAGVCADLKCCHSCYFQCFNELIPVEPNKRKDNLEYAPINFNRNATFYTVVGRLLFEKYTREHHIKIN